MGHVGDPALDRTAPARGVGDGVLLGMDGRLFVAVAQPRLVRRARQKPIVARRDDAIFRIASAHDDAAHVQALARRTR